MGMTPLARTNLKNLAALCAVAVLFGVKLATVLLKRE